MPHIDLRGPTAGFAENEPPPLRPRGRPRFCPASRRGVDQDLASSLPDGRALVDPELTQHTPLIAAPDPRIDRALVGMRGLCLRVFSHFRSCLASRSARGIKTAGCAGALVSWRRSARRRQSPRRGWPRRPPTSAARWPPSPRYGHHLTAIPRSARPPTGTRSPHRRRSRTPAAVPGASRRATRPVRGLERLPQTAIGPATRRLRAAGNCGQRAEFS
jgi:hypothetical protein